MSPQQMPPKNQIGTEYDQPALIELIRRVAYREGDFTLASGKKSNFYCDTKNVSLHPRGARLLGRMVWNSVEQTTGVSPQGFGGVGGPTLGADPIATAASLGALEMGFEVPAFILRKEPKRHGTSLWIEGRENLKTGARLLLVEDVVTTGGSSIKAVEKLREEGFVVDTCVAILDRQEGGAEALAKIGVRLFALSTIDQIRKRG